MVYNKENLINFLNINRSNINSELLLIFLEEPSNVLSLKKQEQIMPEILVEINDERLKFIKEKLAFECRTAVDKDFDFRLQYFKYKLGIMDTLQEQQLSEELQSNLTFSRLMEQVDLDVLYQLLFLSNKNLPNQIKELVADYIGGISIYFARKYQLREFSLSILIALNIQECFERTFFENAIEFFEYVQTDLGYFGYDNPFSRYSSELNQKILNTFYCLHTLEYLYESLNKGNVAI